MTIDEMITELAGLNSMFNYVPMWTNLKETGVLSGLISAGMIITFGVTCVGMFMNTRAVWARDGREKGIIAVNLPLFVKALAIGFFILFYSMFTDTLLGIFGAFTDMFFKKSLLTFRADFHFLLASITSQTDAQTPFFFPSMKASLEVFLFAVSLNLVIILFYVMILYAPALIILGLVAGPVIIPFAIYSKNVAVKWGLFLLAAGFLPAFVGIGIQIINTMGLMKVMATSGLEGKLIQTIFMAVAVTVFMTLIPSVVGQLFGAKPIRQLSAVMGLITLCTATSMSTITQIVLFRKKKRIT